jgi:GxxExxY protein
MRNNNFIFKELSFTIIGVAFKVHRAIGSHLPEHCYESALIHEFNMQDIRCTRQQCYQVYYDGAHVGHFFTDIIVDDKIILELKSDERLTANHQSQLFTYLRVTGLKVGYLINFGTKSVQFKRLIL